VIRTHSVHDRLSDAGLSTGTVAKVLQQHAGSVTSQGADLTGHVATLTGADGLHCLRALKSRNLEMLAVTVQLADVPKARTLQLGRRSSDWKNSNGSARQ